MRLSARSNSRFLDKPATARVFYCMRIRFFQHHRRKRNCMAPTMRMREFKHLTRLKKYLVSWQIVFRFRFRLMST